MKSDSQIREEVIQELRWDPKVTDPDAIGVAVKDGAVTLTGAVSTYAQKFAAVPAASRVYGVKAVADELTVKPTGEPRDDSDIARAIAHILDNNTQIPEGKVHAQVRVGWVTLNGRWNGSTSGLRSSGWSSTCTAWWASATTSSSRRRSAQARCRPRSKKPSSARPR